jgi:hypothetical protein
MQIVFKLSGNYDRYNQFTYLYFTFSIVVDVFFFQCIGATTLDEYRKHIEKDPALERRFQPVKVPEPTVDETIQILRGLRERYELHHKLQYTDDALIAAAKLSYQYIRFALVQYLARPMRAYNVSALKVCPISL